MEQQPAEMDDVKAKDEREQAIEDDVHRDCDPGHESALDLVQPSLRLEGRRMPDDKRQNDEAAIHECWHNHEAMEEPKKFRITQLRTFGRVDAHLEKLQKSAANIQRKYPHCT
mmetsp:Transcript_18785/g.54289  ORF Transcript_18785/g.54289 Transcript_18785/m.54289 type:complete len:113 (+) Transcript_18785:231-569(+)